MRHTIRNAVTVAGAVAWLAVSAWGQQPPQGQAHDDDTHRIA